MSSGKLLCKRLSYFFFLTLIFTTSAVFSQTAGITSGEIYTLASKATGRLLNVSNSSMDNGANVDTWTDTDSDAQRWRVTYSGDNLYTLTNTGSGKLLHIAESQPANSVNVDQYSDTDDNTVKWVIVDAGDGYHELKPAADTNYSLDLSGGTDADGANVQIWPSNNEDPQKWLFEIQTPREPAPSAEITDLIFEAWKGKYYYTDATGGHILNEGFWGVAEMMEIVDDAYEVTGLGKYKDMFAEMYNGFIADEGEDWAWNDFNDDIAWMVIACTRASLLTGNQAYLDKAKEQFDQMFERAWTESYGGGLLWYVGLTTKNSCINGPATVAAMYLGDATGDSSYYDKAIQIYEWSKIHLFDRTTGKVIDAYDGPDNINYWSSTYNQGTYLGAATMLYNHTKDTAYLNDALKIASYTKDNMFHSNVINTEDGRDLEGFKGIFMRYARRYAVDLNRPGYIPWLQKNARVAYNNRNSDNIISTLWGTRSIDTVDYSAFGASTAVSLMVNCPLSTTITRDPYETIEAEDFDYLRGVIVEPSQDAGGNDQLGGIQDGYYTGYMNADFGSTGASSVEFRLSSITEGGAIEIRLGSKDGTLAGTVEIPNTGGWETYETVNADISKITGMRNVYLIYRGSGYICNLNSFSFIEEGTTGTEKNLVRNPGSAVMRLIPEKRELLINKKNTLAKVVIISDLKGRILHKSSISGPGTHTVDVSLLAKGVYFCSIKSKYREINRKFILR